MAAYTRWDALDPARSNRASEGREHSFARRAPPPIAREVTGGVQVEIVEKSGLLSSKRKSSE